MFWYVPVQPKIFVNGTESKERSKAKQIITEEQWSTKIKLQIVYQEVYRISPNKP